MSHVVFLKVVVAFLLFVAGFSANSRSDHAGFMFFPSLVLGLVGLFWTL